MEYSGEENLKTMKLAHNYNAFLVNEICTRAKKENVILDFGSGDGYFAKTVSSKLNKRVLCCEPSDNMQKYYEKDIYSDLSQIEKNALDFIYSLNVLEHIEDDAGIIQKMELVPKENGSIYLYLPAFPCLFSSLDKLVGHYRRYTKQSLIKLFNSDVWEIKELKYADFLGFFVTILFKIIGNKNGSISPTGLKIFDKFIFPVSRFFDKLTGGKICGKNVIIHVVKKQKR